MNQFINIEANELDKPIYRILDYEFVYEMLQTNTNTLISPKLWSDPFENLLKYVRYNDHRSPLSLMHLDNLTYSQCWSFSCENDLLWRVYSPNCNSVRIKTTPRKLLELTEKSKTINYIKNNPNIIDKDPNSNTILLEEIELFIGKVQYLTKKEIQEFIEKIRNPNLFEFISTLYVKREPFINENELRIVIWHMDTDREEFLNLKESLFKYECPFNQLIEEIIFDPRISINKFEALSKSFIELGAKCHIDKSDLYAIPEFIF